MKVGGDFGQLLFFGDLVVELFQFQPPGTGQVVEVLEILLQLSPPVGGQLGHVCPTAFGRLGDRFQRGQFRAVGAGEPIGFGKRDEEVDIANVTIDFQPFDNRELLDQVVGGIGLPPIGHEHAGCR